MKEIGREPLLIAELFIDEEELPAEGARLRDAGELDDGPLVGAGAAGDGSRLLLEKEGGAGPERM
ncbi:MAG TPA: hypothetical protein VG126_07035 [Thermoleophilaceae bacterium]|nr:hypothetical protein [Thermoleophilaceae bacterium]